MVNPRLIVPIDHSPAGEAIPQGQTVFYSTTAIFKDKRRKYKLHPSLGIIPGAGIIDRAANYRAPYKTHVILTNLGILYSMKNADGFVASVQYEPWIDVISVRTGRIVFFGHSIILKYDPETLEEKLAFTDRKRRFVYEILPFIIADYTRETNPKTRLDDDERKLRYRVRKLANFEKMFSRLGMKFNK